MNRKFRIVYRRSRKTGAWSAYCPKLPGLHVDGKTRAEVQRLILERIPSYLVERRKRQRLEPPSRYSVGEDLNWTAPWIDVCLCVELPFWLMLNNTTVTVKVEGHEFPVIIHDNYFELYGKLVTDSGTSALYQGPLRNLEDLGDDIRELRRKNPGLPLMWRKCKTVLRIETRCNKEVWGAAAGKGNLRPQTIHFYLSELCKAHIPVINQLIQGCRLATYDYFAFEVAPWDVPRWLVRRGGESVSSQLLPYREWDIKPFVVPKPGAQPVPYELIEEGVFRNQISATATPGEFELLDALNLMERGDYSGAVRRVTTAIEVVVGAMVGSAIEAVDGKPKTDQFLNKTKTNFNARVSKYEALNKRKLPDALRAVLKATRELRHSIVHKGYRISPGERGRAQRAVDTGRWTFNWFENNPRRQKIREERIAFRSLGRDLSHGIFPTKITPEGVVVLPLH